MRPETILAQAILPALDLLPVAMSTPEARAMVLAMALQESHLMYRHQIGGPARSYWQMEQGGGVRGVLQHPASAAHIQHVLKALDYAPDADPEACYVAIEHNDILAAAFARLLLYTLPDQLPARDRPDAGWAQYTKAWRPGRPHRETWDAYFDQAWSLVG